MFVVNYSISFHFVLYRWQEVLSEKKQKQIMTEFIHEI